MTGINGLWAEDIFRRCFLSGYLEKGQKNTNTGILFLRGGFWDADFQVRDVPDQGIRTHEIPVIARNRAGEKSPSET
jgi:hypothetical protein